MSPRMGIRRLGLRSLGGGRAGGTLPPWGMLQNMLDGNTPSLYADFGRDRYALANVGPNILVNGDFKSGLGNWTVVSGTAVAENGVVRISGDGSGGRISYALSGLVVGRVYSLTLDFVALNGTNVVYAVSPNSSSTGTNADVAASTSALGPRQVVFVATGTTRNIIVAIGNTAVGNYAELAGVIVREITSTLGPNLVQNGDFATDLAGWADASTAPAAMSWVAGQAVTIADGVNLARLRQTISTVPGRTYVFSSTGTAPIGVGTSVGGQELLVLRSNLARTFIATTTATYLSMFTANNAQALDSVSVREVLVGFGPELVANSEFDSDLSGWTDASSAPSTVLWANGQAVWSTDGSAGGRLRTTISTVVGKTYVLSMQSTAAVSLGTTAGGTDVLNYGVGTSRSFIALSSTTYVNIASAVNGYAVPYISIREVLTKQPMQPVTFNDLFSLSSGAKTVIASDNTLQTIPANYPAFDYTGGRRRLLLEGAATNLINSSADLVWTATNATMSPGTLSPDGVNSWKVVTDTNTGAVGSIGQGRSITASTASYVFSVMLKKDAGATSLMRLNLTFSGGTTQTCNATFDPRTGQPGAVLNCTSGCIDFGTYCLIWMAAANNGTNTSVAQYILPASTDLAGSATSSATGSVTVCHAQLEVGDYPSSRILTSGFTASRIADICAFSPLANLCSVPASASMVWRGGVKTIVPGQQLIGLTGWGLLRAAAGVPNQMVLDGSSNASVALGTILPGEIGVAIAWDTTGRAGAGNSGAVATLTFVVDKQMPPFFFGTSSGMSAGTIHTLGAVVAWPLKGSDPNLQSQARVYQ